MSNNEIVPGFDDEPNENLHITLRLVPDRADGLVLHLAGSIDTYNSTYFYEQVCRLIESGYTRLFLHCGSLEHISSTGIGSLTALLKTLKDKGGDMTFFAMGPDLYNMLDMLGFGGVFTVWDSLEAALAAGHTAPVGFPRDCACPSCAERMRVEKPGRFRCHSCGAIMTIDEQGLLSLG
ncbi:MAG: STAS domain-containing protein [Treponema sp.]|jgi:anti-anti-sigma factor|nr:STAS domain-containing protein [Treponema sp.]